MVTFITMIKYLTYKDLGNNLNIIHTPISWLKRRGVEAGGMGSASV